MNRRLCSLEKEEYGTRKKYSNATGGV